MKRKPLLLFLLLALLAPWSAKAQTGNISFADANVKAICVRSTTGWDTNGDGELSYVEAAAVTSLGTVFVDAFQQVGTSVTFNELQYFTGLTSINDDAFSGCRSLAAVTLPPSVQTIGEFSFHGCNSLSSIEIPNSVISIGTEAFRSCGALTSITIPSSVTSIGENPFFLCPALASITVEAGNTVYSSPEGSNAIIKTNEHKLVSGCKNTVIPDGVTTIGASAFVGCSGLTEIYIPSSVTLIDAWAFSNCSGLIALTIPSSVSYIGDVAFDGCINLTEMTVLATTPPYLDGDVFGEVNPDIPIYVPMGNLADYQNYNNSYYGYTSWGNFTNFFGSVTIGDEASNYTHYTLPVNMYYNYSLTQQIYTAEEIGTSGVITSIAFDYVNTLPFSMEDLKVYMKNVDKTTFDSDTDMVDLSDATLVYDGTFAASRAGWVSLQLQTPFYYDGNSNLLLCCYDPIDGFLGYEIIFRQTTTDDNYTALTYLSDLYNPDINNISSFDGEKYRLKYRNNIYLAINPNIQFADAAVKAICVAHWDTNGDGELSYAEAAAVTTLNPSGLFNGNVFFNNTEITSFNELEYFTGLTSINDYAFYGCNNLTSVTLPHRVTSIGNSAFYNCSGLTSVTIGNSMTSIGDSAFNHCTSLTSVTIGNSVTSIGSYAFGSCSGLTSVTIPDSVTSIGSTAFYNCSGLTSVTIGNSVTSIDSFAFEGCSSLTSVTIPASVTSIGSNPFAYCDLLESITVDPGNTVYSSPNGCNAIIKTADHLLVLGCKNTVIPNDVTTIYGHAFYGCIGLTSIEIPASVSNIYTSAFNRCSNLEEIRVWAVTPPTAFTLCFNYVPTDIPVYVPCNTKTAYQQASGWSVFTNYIDPCANIDFAYEAVKAICVEYFDANQDDELSYSEAAAVLSLGTVFQNAFQDEGTSVSFNELRYFTGLTSIDDDAFSSCWSLTALTLPPSVLTIGEFSFYGCNFSSIVIPNSVTSIGSHAFRSCGALTSITIPSSVTSISENPFFYCPALASITVEAGNTVYSSPEGSNAIIKTEEHKLVSGCKNTVIPEGVTTIGASAFGGCSGLTEIHIPSSVTLIDAWALMDCSGLITVTIPSSVSFIGNVAFSGCTGLSSITVERETPPTLDNGVFDNTSIPVYVPCGSLEAYQNYNNTGTPWGGFTNIHDLCENPLCVAPTNVEVTSTEPQNGYNGFTFSFTPGHEEQALWSFYVSEDYELPATYQEMIANGWLGSTNQTVGSYYPTNEDELAMEGTTYYLWVGYNCGTEGDPDIVWSEGPTMVTIPSEIVYNLTSGVNWWAPLAPITLGELKSQLYGIPVVINSQNEGFLFGEDNWSGTLSKSDDYIIQPGEMYKIMIKDDSSKDVYVFAVPQTWANVELQHGYNWFGYTGNTKPIADAIGPNSPPTNGDKIIDENGHEATYQDGSWTGDLTHLYKGRGYVYYSAADYTRSLFLQ
jgi:hypothetical protein